MKKYKRCNSSFMQAGNKTFDFIWVAFSDKYNKYNLMYSIFYYKNYTTAASSTLKYNQNILPASLSSLKF